MTAVKLNRKWIVLAWATITKHHRLGGWNIYFSVHFSVLEAAKSQDQNARRLRSWWRSTSQLVHSCLSLCAHMAFPCYIHVKRDLFSYKGTIPFMSVLPSWLNPNLITFPRPHLQILSHWELGIQQMNSEGIKTLQFEYIQRHSIFGGRISILCYCFWNKCINLKQFQLEYQRIFIMRKHSFT